MKKFLIVVCVIGVVIFLGYIGKEMDLSNLAKNITNNASNSNVVTGKNNTTKNTTNNTNNTKNNTANNTANNTTENTANNTTNQTENATNTTNTTENTTNTTETPAKPVEVTAANDEEKAKTLAKNAYGASGGVYFKVEQLESDGVYIISARDEETTQALAWYTVDVKNNTVK